MADVTADDETLSGPVLDVLATLLAEGRNDEVLAAVKALVKRNEQLERLLAEAGRRRSFKANEGVGSNQLLLWVRDEVEREGGDDTDRKLAEIDEQLAARAEAAVQVAEAKKQAETPPRRRPLKKPLPESLSRVEHTIAVPEPDRPCPACQRERTVIGHDESEVVELVPAKLYVRRDRREKRACTSCDAHVVRAPRGPKVAKGGQIGCSVVAKIFDDKYGMGLPLHRQRKLFRRMGLPLSSSTLADQVTWGARLLRPLWHVAIDQVFGSEVMHIDGTGVPVLDRDHNDGKRLGTLWATVGANVHGPKVAAYFYASTKKAKGQRVGELGPAEILAMRSGLVVSDADTLFAEQYKRHDLVDCGCNMHARRYFVKALDAGDTRAALAIGAFKGLYQVEDDLRDVDDVDERTAIRAERSTPIYDDLVAWCRAHQPEERPTSPLGRAISYLLRHERALRRFEKSGVIPIDNSAAEHAFVPVGLTRKNYLFFGADRGGERAAIAYTMLYCCRLADVDPVEYLTDVLGSLAGGVDDRDLAELMPAAWKARHVDSS